MGEGTVCIFNNLEHISLVFADVTVVSVLFVPVAFHSIQAINLELLIFFS
jgi:uncharacterized membrane protein YwzB